MVLHPPDDESSASASTGVAVALEHLGLRAKFNLVLVPVVAAALSVLVMLDYYHEVRSVMEAHDVHASRGYAVRMADAPVAARTTPEAVADRTLQLHALAGGFTLIALILAVNMTLSRLVLHPIARVRAGIGRLQRGLHAEEGPVASADQVRDVVTAFNDLGLTLDSLLLHALQTERLATLALLSKSVANDVEPEVRHLGLVATRLHQWPNDDARATAHEIAQSAAQILAAIRRLDRPFLKPAA